MRNMKKLEHIKAIAFDADDTLWALQTYFEEVEAEYCDLLSDYGSKEESLLHSSRRKGETWRTWDMASRRSPSH